MSRSASGVTLGVTQKANKCVSGFYLRFAQSGTRPTPIEHSATCETTSGFLTAQGKLLIPKRASSRQLPWRREYYQISGGFIPYCPHSSNDGP
jgi:hypothetical protein